MLSMRLSCYDYTGMCVDVRSSETCFMRIDSAIYGFTTVDNDTSDFRPESETRILRTAGSCGTLHFGDPNVE
jgi:hypothetical protein